MMAATVATVIPISTLARTAVYLYNFDLMYKYITKVLHTAANELYCVRANFVLFSYKRICRITMQNEHQRHDSCRFSNGTVYCCTTPNPCRGCLSFTCLQMYTEIRYARDLKQEQGPSRITVLISLLVLSYISHRYGIMIQLTQFIVL